MSDKLVESIIIGFLLIYAILCLLPFLHVVVASFTTPEEMIRKRFVLFPTEWSLDAYRYVFSTNVFIRSLGVTVLLTVVGTFMNLLFTVLMAYPLAKRELVGRSFVLFLVVFTMLFSGGMIPMYLLVKGLGLINSMWSLILPGLVGAFTLIILKNFFQQIPEGLEESAKIDGYNDLRILLQIVVPLSMPAIATISLFYAVGYWNTFMQAVLYINDSTKWPMQVMLRQVVMVSSGIGDSADWEGEFVPPPQTVRMAVIVIATVPILLVYPFLQKHFAKGAMLGSIKG